MGRHSTILENGTPSSFDLKSESSSGVHTLLTTLDAGQTYNLVRGCNDTYLQHWVVMGNAPLICFSSDEAFDNKEIKIVLEGAKYKMEVVTRHSSSMSNSQRSQSVGATQQGRLKRFFTNPISFIRGSPEPA